MLRIEHLTKRFGDKIAVNDLSLHIAPGEIYGFIGHNGAGKTTTLRSVAGIQAFDQGEIYIDGVSLKEDPLGCKARIAYIPDNPDLYDFMTGIRYLNFVADIFGVSPARRQERIRRCGDLLELTDDLAQPISAYSHGMKQKLAIIAAWLHEPRLVLMDEAWNTLPGWNGGTYTAPDSGAAEAVRALLEMLETLENGQTAAWSALPEDTPLQRRLKQALTR